jgi:hypothetical protein
MSHYVAHQRVVVVELLVEPVTPEAPPMELPVPVLPLLPVVPEPDAPVEPVLPDPVAPLPVAPMELVPPVEPLPVLPVPALPVVPEPLVLLPAVEPVLPEPVLDGAVELVDPVPEPAAPPASPESGLLQALRESAATTARAAKVPCFRDVFMRNSLEGFRRLRKGVWAGSTALSAL